jgi:toxin FitB
VAVEWGRLVAAHSCGDNDGLIAAIAIVHDFIVVTRNSDVFSGIGVSAVNPWGRF